MRKKVNYKTNKAFSYCKLCVCISTVIIRSKNFESEVQVSKKMCLLKIQISLQLPVN